MKELSQLDLERLSRYRDGDLPGDEAASLRADIAGDPALAEGLARLAAIDRLAAELPRELPPEETDRLVRGALAPKPRLRSRVLAGLGAVAAAVLLFVVLSPGSSPRPVLVVAEGPVTVDGRAAREGPLPRETRVATAAGASALLVVSDSTVLLGRNSAVTLGDGVSLEAGTLRVRGHDLALRAPGVEVLLRGTAFLSREPLADLLRVTQGIGREDTMGLWRKLGPALAGAAVGSAVTLVVLDGSAEVRNTTAPPVTVAAGERWTGGKVERVGRGPAAAPAVAGVRPVADTPHTGETPPEPATETMSREALVAEVRALREAREQLLRERHALRRQLDGSSGGHLRHGTYHRMAPEQLALDAEKGKLRLRLPHVFRGPDLEVYDPEVARDVGLTPAEEQAIREIYAGSAQRVHRGLTELYIEMGGDPALAPEMAADSLFREIQGKSHDDDFKAAIRLAARERAGLVPAGADGPPIARALRLLWQEDERVVAELDRILGPDRARRFLDHEETSHSDATFEVGPAR